MSFVYAEHNTEKRRKSSLISRNVTVAGKRTSIRLEPEMWASLKEITKREGCSIHDVCTLVSLRKKKSTSLTAAIRVFLMLYYKSSSTEEGHIRAGHGNFTAMLKRARIQDDANVRFLSSMSNAVKNGSCASSRL